MTYVWHKPRTAPRHGDDWLMTYADLITLLLCFFAIFIITAAPHKKPMPDVMAQVTAPQAEQIPAPLPPPQPVTQAEPVPPAPLAIFPGNLPFHSLEEEDATTLDKVAAKEEPAPPPAETLSQIADTLKTQGGPASFEQKGDRISTLEISSASFFDSGSAVLNKKGEGLLHDVAAKLQAPSFKDYQITVEGHTDDTPIHTAQFPSNWELSTARASAVVHFFLEQGIPATKLRAAGYADTFPKVPNRDAQNHALPGNQAENRRVVIKLEKIEKN